MPEPSLVTLEPADIAVVREVVAMDALAAFYDRAYHEAMAAIQQQGATVGGPPVGVYFGMPTDTVDVAAGFPTPTPVQPVGAVSALQLPGGRAVQVLHIGSYDSMQQTYGGLMQWVQAQGLALGPLMWETYLTEPDDKDPGSMQTLITWPLA